MVAVEKVSRHSERTYRTGHRLWGAMKTLAWSPRVGEVWSRGNTIVEVVAEHTDARLIKLSNCDEWLSTSFFEANFEQECCMECGVPLTMMRRMLIEARKKPAKSKPGSYCTKPCCWPPHAPPTC